MEESTSARAALERPTVPLEDIWNRAFCDLKSYWISRQDRTSDEVPLAITGEDLLKESLRQAVKVYYAARANASPKKSLVDSLNLVWNGWMQRWGLSDLREVLLAYQQRYVKMLQSFSPSGGVRKRDGSLYSQPTWSNQWQTMAHSTGLYDARHKIEEMQPMIGLPSMQGYADEDPYRPMGLAEAYTLSVQSAEANQLKNSLPEEVLGAPVELTMDLFSARLTFTADIVMSSGVYRGKGRPRTDRSDETEGLVYEMHLFDSSLPSPEALSKDLRIVALFEMLPVNRPNDQKAQVRSVVVRHMRTGEVQQVDAQRTSVVPILEGLARSHLSAERQGIYVPRMLLGWGACAPCSLRNRCFSENGVLSRLNPSLAAQTKLAREEYASFLTALSATPVRDRSAYFRAVRPILEWLQKHPGSGPDQALWAFQEWAEKGE